MVVPTLSQSGGSQTVFTPQMETTIFLFLKAWLTVALTEGLGEDCKMQDHLYSGAKPLPNVPLLV